MIDYPAQAVRACADAGTLYRELKAERERSAILRDALRDVEHDLIYCSTAAGRNACEHLKDAIQIVWRALEIEPEGTAPSETEPVEAAS